MDADVRRPHALAHHRGTGIGMFPDPRESAGEHRPGAVRSTRREHPQREGARGEPALRHHRHGREVGDFLADIILRPARHVGAQGSARLALERRAEHRPAFGQAERRDAEGRRDEQGVERRLDMVARRILAAPPGGDAGQLQRLAGQQLGKLREEGGKGGRLEQARAGRIGDHDIARGHRVDQPGHADGRMAIERQRIEQPRIEPAPQRIDALQPGDGADIEPVVEHREIAALDQQPAEIAGEMRLLGIARVEPAGGEQRDARLGAPAAHGQPVAKGGEEGRVPGDVQPELEPVQHLRHRQPVLERIAGAGRRAQMVGEHAPCAVRAATQVDRHCLEVAAARRHETRERAQEERAAGDERGGHMPVGDQPGLAIEIGEHALHHFGALDDARGDAPPFGLGDQQRDGRERPGALLTFAGDAEAGADVLGMAARPLARAFQIVAREPGQLLERGAPGGIVAGMGAEHVVRRARGAIVRDPSIGDPSRVEQRCGAARQASSPAIPGDLVRESPLRGNMGCAARSPAPTRAPPAPSQRTKVSVEMCITLATSCPPSFAGAFSTCEAPTR